MAPTPTTSAATSASAQPPRDTSKDALIIFDTTLRDGEQSPGVTLTADEKVEIATALSALGVDVCEAGFPIASEGDFDAVKRIACEVGPLVTGRPSGKPMVIAGLARAVPADIQRAYDAVRHAPLHRIHTFLATSDIHLQYKLKISREECIQRAVAAVTFARSLGCTDIEFSPEDAGRSDLGFLCSVLGKVIEAGATTLNIPDTVGYNTPEEYGKMIKHLVANTPGGDKVVWSTHCHNDLGLATANTLSGILNGARQVEVTINGIGERAGNTSLEEIVMAIHTHPSYFPVFTNINTRQIYSTSQLVTKKTGMVIQPNKAIVGANAFAHESGIHQDGVLKHKATYEIIQPEIIGLTSGTLVLGKHSGRNAFRSRIEELLGEHNTHTIYLRNNPTSFDALFTKFKKVADSKRSGFTDQDILALVDDHFNLIVSGAETYKLRSVQVVSGSNMLSTATVCIIDTTRTRPAKKLRRQGSLSPPGSPAMSGLAPDEETGLELTDAAIGQGPIHAIFSAINRLIGIRYILASYEVRSITSGSDALGKVLVRISPVDENDEVDEDATRPKIDDSTGELDVAPKTAKRKETFLGQGVDEDILVASAKAYINAVNRMITFRERRKGEKDSTEKVEGLGVSVVGGSGVVPAVPERFVNV